jgi:hypothetical protein
MPRPRKRTDPVHTLQAIREDLRKEVKLLNEAVDYMKKHVDKLWDYSAEAKDRLHDLEVQVNLTTRLLTALCLEVLHMRPRALRRLIKQVEQEALADSQITHLEELFKLEARDKDRKGH